MTPAAAQQRYWLGDSPPEVDDLLVQAEFLGHDAAELLNRIGVAPGADVIDIGCGVLGILPQLRSRAGNDGRVVGLDIEPPLVAVADQLSARHGLAAETVRADAASTGLPSGCFDLVHERMLLLNVTSPHDVVAEMARLARPGGTVVLQEPDSAAWAIDPPHPAWDLLLTRSPTSTREPAGTSTPADAPHGYSARPACKTSRPGCWPAHRTRRILPYVPAHLTVLMREEILFDGSRPASSTPAPPSYASTPASRARSAACRPSGRPGATNPAPARTRPRTAPPGQDRTPTRRSRPS
jgi:SAM-dependent methyltransferase